MIAFSPDALFGLQNSKVPPQLRSAESRARRLQVNLKSRASLKCVKVLGQNVPFYALQHSTHLFLSMIPNL